MHQAVSVAKEYYDSKKEWNRPIVSIFQIHVCSNEICTERCLLWRSIMTFQLSTVNFAMHNTCTLSWNPQLMSINLSEYNTNSQVFNDHVWSCVSNFSSNIKVFKNLQTAKNSSKSANYWNGMTKCGHCLKNIFWK